MRGLILAFGIGIIIIFTMSLITSIATYFFSASLLVAILMVTYAEIRLFAMPATLCNMVLLGVLYERQQMFGGMLAPLIVNLINLAPDFIFVLGFGLTIQGVAIA